VNPKPGVEHHAPPGFSFSQESDVMAARKKAPPPAPTPARRGPSLTELVEDAISGAISGALSAIKNADDHLTDVGIIPGQTDHFSDGVEPRDNGLGYAFTMRYATGIVAKGVLSLQLRDWESGLAAELADAELSPSPAEIKEVVERLNVPKMIEQAVTDHEFFSGDFRSLSSRAQEAFESELDGSVHQSIEAYSETNPKVELPEYPSVYLRWGGTLKKSDVSVQGTGLAYKVNLKTVWEMNPTGWGFDADVRRNTWHRLAASYTYDRRAMADKPGDDTEDLFEGFYNVKQSPKPVLDALVKAYRGPLDEFLKRWQAQVDAGEESAGRTMVYDRRRFNGMIVKYLLANYGMEKTLAQGLANQITQGENY
jgi:hypothetical protein